MPFGMRTPVPVGQLLMRYRHSVFRSFEQANEAHGRTLRQ